MDTTKMSDAAYAQESELKVNTASESLHHVHIGSKSSKSFDKKRSSTLKSIKKHKSHNVKPNVEMQDSSSSESSSSIDSSFLLDSYKVEQHLCKDKTTNDSVVYTRNYPVKSSTSYSTPLPNSSSLVTNQRETFRSSPDYSQCRKEPMGSENTSLPLTTSNKEKSMFPSQMPSSHTKQQISSNIQERIMHTKHQNSASENSKLERNITSQQRMSPSFDSVGQYVRPPLIGQSSDILLQSGVKQSTSESSESVTSNTSCESRDSLTSKVESLIGEEVISSKIKHSYLSSMFPTSVTPPLQRKQLQKNISGETYPQVLDKLQKESVMSQKHCGLFSQEESHAKRELSDAVKPQIISSMTDTSDNHLIVHSQLSEQKQMAISHGELSERCGQGIAETKIAKYTFSESAHVMQCTEQAGRSSVNEPGVVAKHNSSVFSTEAISEEDAFSSEQFLLGKEDSSSHYESGEYSNSDMEVRGKNTPLLLTDMCSVIVPDSSHSLNNQLIVHPSSDQDFAHLAQNAESSRSGFFSSSGAHSDGDFTTELLSTSTVMTSMTERMKQSSDFPLSTGTDTVSCGQLMASNSGLKMPAKTSVSLGVLTSSPEGHPVHSTSSKHIFISGTFTHSSGVLPVTISPCESLPLSSNLRNGNTNVQSSVLLSSYSAPSHQSVNGTFPPSSYVAANNCSVSHLVQSSLSQTVVPDSLLLTVSSDVNGMSSTSSSIPVSNIRSSVSDTSSPGYVKKGSTSPSIATNTSVANDFSNGPSTAAVSLTYSIPVSEQALLFTGSFSDSAVEPFLMASSKSPVHHAVSCSSVSDSENVIKKGSRERHRPQNELFSYQQNKFHTYPVYNLSGITSSSGHPQSPRQHNQIMKKKSVCSTRVGTSAIKNITSKSDSDFDQHKLHNLRRQVTGSSTSSSSSSGSSCNCTSSQKSLSDQEAERSISEITVSAESIQTIISVPRKSSNADTEAEVSDESKNGCEHPCDEVVHTRSVMDNKDLPKVSTSITITESQHPTGFYPQPLNHGDKSRKHQPQRLVTACRNEANVDESEKSEYQSDHRESPMSVSSLASSKRLEWDNGADIGYETAPGMLSNLEQLKPSDFALLFRSDPEGGALSNKKTPSYQQASVHNQLLTPDSATSVTPVENTCNPSQTAVFAVPSTSEEMASKRKNEDRLASSASDNPSSSVKHYYQSHLVYVPKRFNLYDICVQTEPKYFTKEAGVQAKLSFRSEGSLSSSYGSTSSDNTVKVPAKNRRHRLRHTAAVASLGSGRTQFHLRAAGQPLHQSDDAHEGLKESLLKSSVHRDRGSSPLNDASYSTDTLLKEITEDQHFQQNFENLEKNSENLSEEEHGSYSEHTKYFTDISSLQLQFPYPQQFLPSNISSVLVFDENSAYPEFLPDGADISELGDNVVFLQSSDHEQLLSDQTDGPHIRWYPVSGRSNSQEIRDAATQTAVSYIAEQDPEVYVDSQSEQSQINNSSNTISSAQVSESESLDYLACSQSRVRKHSDSGKENILPSDIQHSHYGTSESHTVSYETRCDSAMPHLLESEESHKIFYRRPLTSEETVPKSLTFPSSSSEQEKISSTTQKNSKNAYFFMNQNAKLPPQSHDALPRYEFQTLNDGDSLQSKSYDSKIRGPGQTSFHHSATDTRMTSGHVAHGNVASRCNNTQVPYEVTVSDIMPPSEALQFQVERPSSVENVHYKVLKFLPKEKTYSDNYGDTVVCRNTLPCFSQNDDSQSSELENSSLGQTQASRKLPSCHNNKKQKEFKQAKEMLGSAPESTQKSKSGNSSSVSPSLDEALHLQHISDNYPYHSYMSKNCFMYLPDERRENHRVLRSSKSEELPHKRIGGVGGNVPLDDQSQFITNTSANITAVTVYMDPVSHVPLTHAYPEYVKNRTDLELHLLSREASVVREETLDQPTDIESTALTSMSQSETAESMHTGSDDAAPPKFPPEVLGSRREPIIPSPGIYGNRKFTQKYGHRGLKKFPSDSNLYDSKHSSNMDSHISRPLDVVCCTDKDSEAVKDSEKTIQLSSGVNASCNTNSDPKIATSNEPDVKQKVKVKNLDAEENSCLSQNTQLTQYQANSAQSKFTDIPQDHVVESHVSSKSESSDTATISISSEYHLPNKKNYGNIVRNNVLLSDDPTRDTKDSRRIALEPKSHVAQKAKVEISKLENLVSRQKKNYLRRLQLEIERLTRLEDLVTKHTSKYASVSNSSLSSNGIADQTVPKYVSTGDVNEVLQHLGQPQESVVSYESETSESSVANVSHAKYTKKTSSGIAKHRNVKIQVSLGDMGKNQHETAASLNSRNNKLGNGYVQMKDFGQNCPTPVSSNHDFTQTKSVGVQTYDSLLDVEGHTKFHTEKVRMFISLEGAQKKEKSKKPSSSKTVGVAKMPKANPRTRVEVPPSIAWNVSHRKFSDRRWKRAGTYFRDHSGISLQDAFHRNCGHLIRRSQARLMRITKLAELRNRLTAVALEKARFGQTSNYRIASLKNSVYPLRRHFTHKEIRIQTERIYKNLSEVVEVKEKKKREEMYRTNRLMAEIYKKKLQEQVLKGKVNWTISQTCLTA